MQKISEEEIIKILKENRFKVTPQRLAICKAVLSSTNHPSAEQVYENIKQKYPTISRATVYKTLSLLKEIGLISELRFNDTYTRYDPNISLHINIVCPVCLSIYDFKSEKLSNSWKSVISDIEGKIIGHRIDVYKICEKCEENSSSR